MRSMLGPTLILKTRMDGFTPTMRRMASNHLAIAVEALARAGVGPNIVIKGADSTSIEITRRSTSIQFAETWRLRLAVLKY